MVTSMTQQDDQPDDRALGQIDTDRQWRRNRDTKQEGQKDLQPDLGGTADSQTDTPMISRAATASTAQAMVAISSPDTVEITQRYGNPGRAGIRAAIAAAREAASADTAIRAAARLAVREDNKPMAPTLSLGPSFPEGGRRRQLKITGEPE